MNLNKNKWLILQVIFIAIVLGCVGYLGRYFYHSWTEKSNAQTLAAEIEAMRKEQMVSEYTANTPTPTAFHNTTDNNETVTEPIEEVTPIDPFSIIPELTVQLLPKILPYYKNLYIRNSDLIGWIYIANTMINYPVVQGKDNDFYLNKDIDKEYARCGCLFVDCRADVFRPSTNLIIYGHNMKDGSMFHDIIKYEEESFYLNHPIIKFDTLYESAEYEIISAFYSQLYPVESNEFKYYQWFDANTKEDFDKFVTKIRELSIYEIPIEVEYGDTFLTLSTCSHHMENGRFAVVARKKAK